MGSIEDKRRLRQRIRASRGGAIHIERLAESVRALSPGEAAAWNRFLDSIEETARREGESRGRRQAAMGRR